ncbi:MAG: acyltransferase [Clostridium sp.]|nr:acyltransferase [Clostridium sp.]
MKKYMRAAICFLYSLIKFGIIKIVRFHQFKYNIMNIISPFVEFDIDKFGTLKLSYMVKVRSGSKIKVRNGGYVSIGENTSFNHNCILVSHENIIVGKDVQLGPNVVIYDHDHDYKLQDGMKKLLYKTSPISIDDGTWIGANAVILKGTHIGKNCVVAAGTILNGGIYDDNSLIYQKKDILVKEIIRSEN